MENEAQRIVDNNIEETKDAVETIEGKPGVYIPTTDIKDLISEEVPERIEAVPIVSKVMETSTHGENSAKITPLLKQGVETTEMATDIPSTQICLVKAEPSDTEMDTTSLSDFPAEPRINLQSKTPTSITEQVATEQEIESKAVLQINNSALALLSQYISSDSESNITDSDEERPTTKSHATHSDSSSSSSSEDIQMIPNINSYRVQDGPVIVSDTETSVTGMEELESDNESSEDENGRRIAPPIKSKGEMLPSELPPIEDLQISVPESECKPIGHVESIVAQIVIVQSYAGVELLNLDTVLFLEKGKRALGKIFDVIGQVTAPMYCVLFNNRQDVVQRGISVGMPVYCAPQTEHTSFIILSDLMKHKGSDASWLDDNEAPDYVQEYSDDEQERIARRRRGSCSSSDRNTPDGGHTSYKPYQSHHSQRRGHGRRGYGYRGRHGHSWHTNLPAQHQAQRFINPFAFAAGLPPPPPPPQENNHFP